MYTKGLGVHEHPTPCPRATQTRPAISRLTIFGLTNLTPARLTAEWITRFPTFGERECHSSRGRQTVPGPLALQSMECQAGKTILLM